jgi:lipoprotein NlpD
MVRCGMKRYAVMIVVSVLIAGCTARQPAPVSDRTAPGASAPAKQAAPARAVSPPAQRPKAYVVRKGDTLYSIALDHGLDHRDLAAWNNVEASKIQVGQQLSLFPPSTAVTTAPLKSAPPQVESRPLGSAAVPATGPAVGATGTAVKSEPLGVRVPYSDQAYGQLASVKPGPIVEPKPAVRSEPERGGEDDLGWIWPASGKVISGFNESANLKGIAIAGKLGQPVLASAPGRVIFSGTGIRGFGKLIVIKHNETFLSVYAHNHTLLVKEQQTVAKGQKIAEMGSTDTDQVKLHFEIRRLGKPVDPSKLLPERPG